MKPHLKIMGFLFVSHCAALAQLELPVAVPGPFAPVPARIAGGPEAPTVPMEPKAPVMENCKNAAAVLKKLGIRLTGEQKSLIDKQRFLLLPIESTALAEALPESDEDRQWAFTSDEMLMAFEQLGGAFDPASRNAGNARLVTPDLVLHAWHRGFARTLEYIEQYRMHEVLTAFLNGTLENTRALRATATGPAKDRLAWTEARFAAPWVLLGPPAPPVKDPEGTSDPDHAEDAAAAKAPEIPYHDVVAKRLAEARKNLPAEAGDALAAEIKLVLAEEGMAPSPLFGSVSPGKPADYTQFKPRSHYTKNNTLGGYFRAMMFLGRNGYDLKAPNAIGDAILAALAMSTTPPNGKSPVASWKELMEITGFFAGESDDVTYPELRKWLTDVLGKAVIDPSAAVSDELAKKLAADLTKLRPPQIVSSAHPDQQTSPDSDPPSFRICGQRFTWDARVLSILTRGAPQAMPSTPTAVMVPAAFGDVLAAEISQKFVAKNPNHAAEFEIRLPECRKEIAAVTDDAWFNSMASKQLHVMATLTRPRNANFPAFMTSDAFRAKNLDSILGSFTELKHDTVLYAKQVYAEGGEGGESDKLPPVVKGFVQPDVPFWREMERLAVFAADGFSRHKLLPDADEKFSRFRLFASDMGKLRKIAEKHVAGSPLTTADWETIRTVDLSYIATPLVPGDEPKPGDGKCAMATDILTDANAGTILCEALGRPYVMIALVGGKDGNRMVAGLAYNHFEFSRPLAKGRLTDEEWQAKIYQPVPELPAKAPWKTAAVKPTTVPAPKE